jgi:hypothetical protein
MGVTYPTKREAATKEAKWSSMIEELNVMKNVEAIKSENATKTAKLRKSFGFSDKTPEKVVRKAEYEYKKAYPEHPRPGEGTRTYDEWKDEVARIRTVSVGKKYSSIGDLNTYSPPTVPYPTHDDPNRAFRLRQTRKRMIKKQEELSDLLKDTESDGDGDWDFDD